MNPEQFQKHCELQALWWIAYANTGACKNRKLFHMVSDGGELGSVPFTDEEKVEEAMNTASNHIRLFRESCEEQLKEK